MASCKDCFWSTPASDH